MLFVSTGSKWSGKEVSLISAFVVSLVIAMFFCVIYKNEWLLQTEILSSESLSLIKTKNFSKGSLFLYVLQKRIWIIPVVFLMSTTYLAAPTVYGIIAWYGMSVGGILSLCLLRYGIKGFFFLLFCGLPQYLFYLPSWIIAFRVSMEKRNMKQKLILQSLVLEGIVLAGCFMESFVNSMILPKIIKIFIGV